MNIRSNTLEEGLYNKNEVSIIRIPQQKFLVIYVKKNSTKFNIAIRIGILKYLSQLILMEYEKENKTKTKVACEKYKNFSLEKIRMMPNFISDRKENESCALLIRQPNFINEDYFKKIYSKAKKNSYHPILEEIEFLITGSRLCAQIIQTESTAEIKGSLEELDRYILSNNYEHADRYFREIYLNSSHEKKGRSGTRILRCNISKAADQKYKAKSNLTVDMSKSN